MDYKKMFKAVSSIHKKTGRSRILLFFDMIYCAFRYGAAVRDYRLCEFYNLTREQRETYVTRGINNRLVQLLNDPDYYHVIDNKIEFLEKFSKYVKRAWFVMEGSTPESFKKFIAPLDTVIAKPVDASCGEGIIKLKKIDFASTDEMYAHIKEAKLDLVEEFIVQNEALSILYPGSVNSYRIVTVYSEGKGNMIYAVIKIGGGGSIVDNITAGGMTVPINTETSTIDFPAYDTSGNLFEVHPDSGCRIVGHKLPFVRESIAMCEEAAMLLPELKYIGWDVAVTADGPQFIEGNYFPGHGFLQLPPHTPDKIGMLPKFRKYVNNI